MKMIKVCIKSKAVWEPMKRESAGLACPHCGIFHRVSLRPFEPLSEHEQDHQQKGIDCPCGTALDIDIFLKG